MKYLDRRIVRKIVRLALLALVAVSVCEVVLQGAARAQANQGWDAVYNSSNNPAPSPSFLDATQFFGNGQGKDMCDTIYGILSGLYLNKQTFIPGSVIDARAMSGSSALTCTHGSPWTEGSNTVSVPSTILLPAGTIVIPTKWVLPSNTHLVGEGSAISGLFTLATTLQVSSSFTANTPMIQFGSSSGCCSGISLYSCANTTKCTTDTLYGCQGTNGWHGIQ